MSLTTARPFRRALYLAACIAIAVSTCPRASASETNGLSTLQKTGAAFASIAESATPAVVFIKSDKKVSMGMSETPMSPNNPFESFGDEFFQRFFRGPGVQQPRGKAREFHQEGQGSGFLISDDGYILTNHHVVGDADKIEVRLSDGREFDAKMIGTDAKSEVAVIKIDAKDLPHLELGDSSALKVGEWVVAIGNPFGLSASVTAGVVSAKGRSGIGIADYENFIQTDAAINPGNSGGPLLNIEGQVVGINTAIYSRNGGYMGIGFAIPINMAKSIETQLVKNGKVTRGFLGVLIQEMTPDLAESFGLHEKQGILVSEVYDGSPAAKAGIKQGDVILDMDGKPTQNVSGLRNEVASLAPGTKIELTVFRDGKEMDLAVKTGKLDDKETMVAEDAKEADGFGLSVQDLTAETAQRFGYGIDDGALVTAVEADSQAARQGIEPGDLVTSVDRKPVANAKEFRTAVKNSGKKGVLLCVKNDKGSRFVFLRSK